MLVVGEDRRQRRGLHSCSPSIIIADRLLLLLLLLHHRHHFNRPNQQQADQTDRTNRIMLRGGDLTSHMDGYNTNDNHNNHKYVAVHEQQRSNATTAGLYQLYHASRPEHCLLIWSMIILGLTSAVQLTTPYVTSRVIDGALQFQKQQQQEEQAAAEKSELPPSEHLSTTTYSTTQLLLLLFAIMSVASYLTYLRSVWQCQCANNLTSRLRQQVFAAAIAQDAAFFDDPTEHNGANSSSNTNSSSSTGDILSRLSSDAEIIQNSLATSLMGSVRNALMALGAAILCASISWRLALLALLVLPPSMVVAKLRGREMQKRNGDIATAFGRASSRAAVAMAGIRTVQLSNAESYEQCQYATVVKSAHHFAVAAGRRQFQSVAVIQLLSNGSMMLVLGYGGHLVAHGYLSAGQLAAFVMYSLILAGNITGLSSAYLELSKTFASMDRLMQIIEREPNIPKSSPPSCRYLDQHYHQHQQHHQYPSLLSPKNPPRLEGRPVAVSFQNVSFRYPSRPNVTVLKDFSLEISPGQTVAVVGYSGAGKSTVAALLTRLYNVTQGQILLDGIDIATLSPHDVRERIGVVSQEPTLFPNTTIADNIRYGSFYASDREVYEAAVAAHVWDFAQHLPDGLQTLVGPTQLSGGQKQRVAIARCLLKKSYSLVILDEATSALDAESEHAVQQALEAACTGRTVLVIAHRLSSIQRADNIAVVEGGRLVESGTFHDLVNKPNGFFRRLVERQLQDDARQ
jgi:ABC-type multidrug transport system fused ATPase/permease subunit